MKPNNLPHRDDFDMNDVAAIEAELAKSFPGMKVVFAGDNTAEMPPEVQQQLDAIREQMDRAFFAGQCTDCGATIPDFRPRDDNWTLPNGWRIFTAKENGEDIPVAWQCPDCDAKDNETTEQNQ